jgi:hypothetical protein
VFGDRKRAVDDENKKWVFEKLSILNCISLGDLEGSNPFYAIRLGLVTKLGKLGWNMGL